MTHANEVEEVQAPQASTEVKRGGTIRILRLVAVVAIALLLHPAPHLKAVEQHKAPIHKTVVTSQPVQQPKPATVIEAVAPAPAVAPEPPVAKGCAAYKHLIAQYDWNVNVMTAVMRAESSCNPNAVNRHNYDGVYDYGLLQLHGQRIYDPAANVAAAHRLWKVQGYRAWSAYKSGRYLSYL